MLKKRGNPDGGQTQTGSKRKKQKAKEQRATNDAKAKQNKANAKAKQNRAEATKQTSPAPKPAGIFSKGILAKLATMAKAASVPSLYRYHATHEGGAKNKHGINVYDKC